MDPDLDRSKASFQQGDACDLSKDLGTFDCVLAANLICRLHTPRDFFSRLASLINPGGILVITSPYTFMTEYTPRSVLHITVTIVLGSYHQGCHGHGKVMEFLEF